MKPHFKTIMIGLFVVIACSILVGMILFFEPTVGDGKQEITVRFANINGINVGTRVALAGRPIGEVTAIQQIPDARAQPSDELGNVYFYQLICHIDSSARVYTTDSVSVQTSGLLGERSISIMPKRTPHGILPKIATSDTPLYGQSADPIESAFNELSDLTDKAEDALTKVVHWIDENGAALGSTVHSISNIAAKIDKGEGTVGHLVSNEETFLRLSSILTKANTLMNDVNQYGLLFNLNKQWQRLRVKRASLLASLESPEEFRAYFEREFDLIGTSLERISMLIEKAEERDETYSLVRSDLFLRDYAELMRGVDALQQNLKLYNEKLMDAQMSAR